MHDAEPCPTLCQLDSFNNILVCFHGRKKMSVAEIEKVGLM